MKRSKRYQAGVKLVQPNTLYGLKDAISLVKKMATARFDESLEINIQLGIDPKKSEQHVRGSVVLPHGSGKTKRVVVIANPQKQKEAISAGADQAGGEELVKKISTGWLDFDAIVATPDMMKVVARVGKVLGPRGLMPSPKLGTVTVEVGQAIKEIKAGKIQYKNDATGVIHTGAGKISLNEEELLANARALLTEVIKARPSAVRGRYIKSISISSTMSPGIKVNPEEDFS